MTDTILWTYTPDLQPEKLTDLNENERRVAVAIRAVTESRREQQRLNEPPGGVPMGLLDIPMSRAAWLGWDVLLQDFTVVHEVADLAATTEPEVVRVARDRCRPRHWRSLMWFSFSVDLLNVIRGTSSNEAIEAAHQAQRAFAERVRKSNASEGGRAKNEKYYSGPRQWVRDEWQEGQDEFQSNKSKFSRAYVELVKMKFDVDVSDRTIREVWLKD